MQFTFQIEFLMPFLESGVIFNNTQMSSLKQLKEKVVVLNKNTQLRVGEESHREWYAVKDQICKLDCN